MNQAALIRLPNKMLWNERLQAPLGLLALAAYLRRTVDCEVSIVDLSGRYTEEQWGDVIPEAHYFGVSATTGDMGYAARVATWLKEHRSSAYRIIGGAHASVLAKDTLLKTDFDYAVFGEGEKTLSEIVAGKPLDVIDGLAYKNGWGAIYVNTKRESIKELDSLPHLAWQDIAEDSAVSYELVEEGERASCISTSRGCPYRCAFCSNATWEGKVRLHSAEWVYEELRLMKKILGVTEVRLVDEIIGLKPERLTAICDQFRKTELKFRTHLRCDLTTRPNLVTLRDAGCVEVAFGVESGSQRILNHIRKGVSIEQAEQAIAWTKEVGMVSKAYFIIGLPGESPSSVQDTVDFIERVQPDRCTLSTFQPYPGSPIYDHPEEFEIEIFSRDWSRYWLLGWEDTNEGFAARTPEMDVPALVQARKRLMDYMRDEGRHK